MFCSTVPIVRGRENLDSSNFARRLLAIWFLLPWLCFIVGAFSLAISLVGEWKNPWPVAVSVGGIGLGQILALLQGYDLIA